MSWQGCALYSPSSADTAGKLFRRALFSHQKVEKISGFHDSFHFGGSILKLFKTSPQSLGGTTFTRLESGGAALSALTPVPCMESHIHLGLASWLQDIHPRDSWARLQKINIWHHISIFSSQEQAFPKIDFILGVKFQEFTSEAMHPVENDYVCNLYRYIYLKRIGVGALEGSYSHHSSQEAGFLHWAKQNVTVWSTPPAHEKSPKKETLGIHSNTMILESLDLKFKIQDSEPSVFSSTLAPSQPRPHSSCARNGTLHPRGPLLPSKGSQCKLFQFSQTLPDKWLDRRIYQSVWRAMSKLD